jgi:tetratricopeptide (TPR) repeat protein
MRPIRHLTFLLLCLFFASCGHTTRYQEAKHVIAVADSLDQNEHLLYPDTAALQQTIRTLDNPFGRLFAHNTLGKAHYYMGRHLSLNDQITQAAAHYIAADRAQIDDPIYRGRINSCMAHICKQNESDSLALIFFERANNDFKLSGNEWYYAHSLLDVSEYNLYLHYFSRADSILKLAETYTTDDMYLARFYETKGLYFYELQQYDSALVYFKKGLPLWQHEEYRLYSYMKIMQVYLDMDSLAQALPYAQSIIHNTQNPTFLVNAYYCMMQDANDKNDTKRLSEYSHARADAEKSLRDYVSISAETVPKFNEYLSNPYPLRWVWILISCIIGICLLLVLGIILFRRYSLSRLQVAHEEQIRMYDFNACLSDVRTKFPTPPRRWNDYMTLTKDIDPFLHDWLMALEQLPLSARERIFCIYYMVYPQFSLVEIAKHINYAEKSIRTYKARVAAKLQCSSANLHDYLSSII